MSTAKRSSWPQYSERGGPLRPEFGLPGTRSTSNIARATHGSLGWNDRTDAIYAQALATQAVISRQSDLLQQQHHNVRRNEDEFLDLAKQFAEGGSPDQETFLRLGALQSNSRTTLESLERTSVELRASCSALADILKILSLERATLIGTPHPEPDVRQRSDSASLRTRALVTPEHASSTSPEHEHVLPAELQAYYDAAGWVGVYRERLEDCQQDYHQHLARKRENPDAHLLLKSDADHHFDNELREAEQHLLQAKSQAKALLQDCMSKGIHIEHKLPSSAESSETRSRSVFSSDFAMDIPSDQGGARGSFISRWADDVVQNTMGDGGLTYITDKAHIMSVSD